MDDRRGVAWHSVVLGVFLLLQVSIFAQNNATLSGWQRNASTDALTGERIISYTFTREQSDGRRPYIFLVCRSGRVDGWNAGYFTDSTVFYDANGNRSSVSDLNSFGALVRFRGATGKVQSAWERVRIADQTRLTLMGGELEVFGRTGSLTIQFQDRSGYLLTDVFQQPGVSVAEKERMDEDCFKGKGKRK
jgi:hypothetical protein